MNARSMVAGLLSAVSLILAFPRFGYFPLTFFGLVPVLSISSREYCMGKSAFRLGWFVGLIFHLGTLWWLAKLYETEIVYPVLRLPALISLAACLGLFYAAAIWGWNRTSGTRWWWTWPGIWVMSEYLRSLTSMAFPWTLLPYALVAQPLMLQPASVGGVWFLDLGIATIAILFAQAIRTARFRIRYASMALLLAAGWVGWSVALYDSEPGTYPVAIVQPNALPSFKWQPGGRGRVFHDLREMSAAAAESLESANNAFLIWPETAVPVVIRPGGGTTYWLSDISNKTGMPLVTGALGVREKHGEELPTNSAYLVRPGEGIVARYDKLHLVPFSEKMPFSGWIPHLKKLNLGQGDYARGTDIELFDIHGAQCSVLICFEAILPRLVRRHVRAGAHLLINITNDSWFGDTGAPEQHAAIAVVRAVEHRRWLIRAANTGVSLIADPWGRIVSRSSLFQPEIILGTVQPREEQTPYTKFGDWVVYLSFVLTICGILGSRRKTH